MENMKKIGKVWVPTQIFNHEGEELYTCVEIYTRASSLSSYTYKKSIDGAVSKLRTAIERSFIKHSGCPGMLLTLEQIERSN